VTWSLENSQGNESLKIRWEIVPYTRGKVLDLGCGPFKGYPHFIGVDSCKDSGLFGGRVKPDVVCDCENLSIFASQSIDAVFSSHLLEHIVKWEDALKEWWRLVKHGGVMVLYLPHKDFYPNVGKVGSNVDHVHDFTPQDIIDWMEGCPGGWDLLVNEERNGEDEYSFLQVYRKRQGHQKNHAWKDPKPSKRACVVRYGGVGDMLMASSILPGLKDQGYHVTFNTTPNGYEILKEDPHVDEWMIQDRDQVPNGALPEYWGALSRKFDKFVNLSESIEGTLLAIPGRPNHRWPDNLRKVLLDGNYLAFTHALAGVPFEPRQKFYPTAKEKEWAEKYRKKLGGQVVMWALSGSSVHKAWPYLDAAIAGLMIEYPLVKVVLVGGETEKLLESGWENEPRVIRKSGEFSIRETLALAEVCDLVVGPETGVLNSVGFLGVPKIVFLSHSSVENLTRDWKNCVSLVPDGCGCWPCHQMHYGFEHCKRDEATGVAECAAKIPIEDFRDAVYHLLGKPTGIR